MLGGLGQHDGHPEHGGRERPHAFRLCGPSDEQHPAYRDAVGADGVQADRQPAQHALDGSAGQVLRGHVRAAQAVYRARRVRQVGGALAVEVRQQCQAAGPRVGREREPVEPGEVDTEELGGRGEHPGRVERAHQRQEAAAGVGEPGHGAARVHRRGLAHAEHRAARAERDDHVPLAEFQSQRGGHVVAGARGDEGAVRSVPSGFGGAEHPRQLRVTAPERSGEDVAAVGAFRGRKVPRPRRVTTIGDRLRAGEAPGQPVVWQEDAGDAVGILRLVVSQPTQFGDGEARDGHAADRLGPDLRAAELAGQVGGGARRARVVPQQCGAHDLPAVVEGDHAVLLSGDPDRRHAVEQAVAGGPPRLPPTGRVHLGGVRVVGPPGPHDPPGPGLADQHLGRLRGRVDPRHQNLVVVHDAELPR